MNKYDYSFGYHPNSSHGLIPDCTSTLGELRDGFLQSPGGEKLGAFIMRGPIIPHPDNPGVSGRKNATLKSISFITIDGDSSYDANLNIIKGAPDPKLVKAFLDTTDYNYLLYPTHSNKEGSWRWRLLIPCRNIRTQEELTHASMDIVHQMNSHGIPVAYSLENHRLTGIWFLTKPKESDPGLHDWTHCVEDQNYYLQKIEHPEVVTAGKSVRIGNRRVSSEEMGSISVQEAIHAILEKGEPLHDSLVVLASYRRYTGSSMNITKTELLGMCNSSPRATQDPQRMANIEEEVDSIIKWCFETIEKEPEEETDLVCKKTSRTFAENKPYTWALKNFARLNKVFAINGQGGIGKTTFSLALGFCMAGGRKWGAFEPTKAFKVLYVSMEDNEEDFWPRSYHMHQRCLEEFTEEEIKLLGANMFDIWDPGKIGPFMIKDAKGNPLITQHLDRLKKVIRDNRIEVVFLDTKAQFYGLDENDNVQSSQWTLELTKMANELSCTVFIVGHTGKGLGENGYASRGASAYEDSVRGSILLGKLGKLSAHKLNIEEADMGDYYQVTLNKTNFSPAMKEPMVFKRGEAGLPEMVTYESQAAEVAENESSLYSRYIKWVCDKIAAGEDRLSARKLNRGEQLELAKKEVDEKIVQDKVEAFLALALETGKLVKTKIKGNPYLALSEFCQK